MRTWTPSSKQSHLSWLSPDPGSAMALGSLIDVPTRRGFAAPTSPRAGRNYGRAAAPPAGRDLCRADLPACGEEPYVSSDLCISVLSIQRSNLLAALRMVPTDSKPSFSCSCRPERLSVATVATIVR